MWTARVRNVRNHIVVAALLLTLVIAYLAGSSPAPAPAPEPRPVLTGVAALPEGPEKELILEHCDVCHGLDWVLRSGGTEEGWTDRLRRMIRSGATITPEQIPALAAYLAKALPPRPVQEEDAF